MTPEAHFSTIRINCIGYRNLKAGESIDFNTAQQISWDIAMDIKDDADKARRIYCEYSDRLKSIAKGTIEESLNFHEGSTVLPPSKLKRIKELYECGFTATMYCFIGKDIDLRSNEYRVKEEDFVREFHEELRCYGYSHITDDLHWGVFQKTGGMSPAASLKISPSDKLAAPSNTSQASPQNSFPKDGCYDKGNSYNFHMGGASFYKIITYVLLIVVIIMAYFLIH